MNPILWKPDSSNIETSNMYRFMKSVARKFHVDIEDYSALHRWSIDHFCDFWEHYRKFSQIQFHAPPLTTLSSEKMPGARWFEGAALNYTENLLQGDPERIAIIGKTEEFPISSMTYGELSNQVKRFGSALEKSGIKAGDRVAGLLPNIPETVVAMLGTAAIGAVWTSCSPDFGPKGVMDRFGQIEPKILICANSYHYGGVKHEISETLKKLIEEIPSVEKVILVPNGGDLELRRSNAICFWDDFLSEGDLEFFKFVPLPFNHPLFIMYSSGTTGLPKCLVHGAGGTLLQHHKEHALHCNIDQNDVVFFYTTCGWMMWNWLVSCLAQKAAIVLYDGSPVHPSNNTLWKLVEELGITVFGTSPKFLSINRQRRLAPKKSANLSSLKTILSTGSPLNPEDFRWVYKYVKEDIQLSSICGGTDIISCFILGNPMLPVREGEIQCIGLGMDVVALNEKGKPVFNEKGELACRKPFPSMPLEFWNDPDGAKYRRAYFHKAPGIWVHGDYVEIKDHGGVIVYGRSDATLNPSGIRIGVAEIYRIVEAMEEVKDSLIIGVNENSDVQTILFVVLEDDLELTDNLTQKIKNCIKLEATPRHSPKEIYRVSEIPVTMNGKKVELTVRDIFEERLISNRDSLANPDCLHEFESIKAKRKKRDNRFLIGVK